MPIPSNNPLYKHFRQPTVYLQLPSNGQFWDETAIDLPPTGELPIYPMTVKDEITFKTPDALMNGEGVVTVIQSCCPNIKNAWAIPVIDLDPILIAIRMSSYGAEMDITTKCPHCGEDSNHGVDLRILLSTLPKPEFPDTTIDNLKFKFKPITFQVMNQINLFSFEQQRLIDAITNSNLSDEEKMAQFKTVFPKLAELNVTNVVNGIASVETEEGDVVSDEKFIKEFVNNCETGTYNKIKETIETIGKNNKLKPLEVQCSECAKQYTTELNFEEANFFV